MERVGLHPTTVTARHPPPGRPDKMKRLTGDKIMKGCMCENRADITKRERGGDENPKLVRHPHTQAHTRLRSQKKKRRRSKRKVETWRAKDTAPARGASTPSALCVRLLHSHRLVSETHTPLLMSCRAWRNGAATLPARVPSVIKAAVRAP